MMSRPTGGTTRFTMRILTIRQPRLEASDKPSDNDPGNGRRSATYSDTGICLTCSNPTQRDGIRRTSTGPVAGASIAHAVVGINVALSAGAGMHNQAFMATV